MQGARKLAGQRWYGHGRTSRIGSCGPALVTTLLCKLHLTISPRQNTGEVCVGVVKAVPFITLVFIMQLRMMLACICGMKLLQAEVLMKFVHALKLT